MAIASRSFCSTLWTSLFLIAFMSAAYSLEAQTFTNKTSLLSETDFHSGVAIGIVDMNGDGKDDIVRLDDASDLSIEYQQLPDAAFGNYTFGNLGSGREWSLCVGDVNNDGFNDFIAGGAYNEIKLLTANATGTDYTSSDLPGGTIFLQGSNFVDINNDGWLDIFACHDDNDNAKYRNLGNGTFVVDSTLIDTLMPSGNSGNYASLWTDYDNDGDLDMYLSKCRQGVSSFTDPRRINRLFQNDGTSNFTEVQVAAGMAFGDQSWASDFADIDNDGDMDCFIINHGTSSVLMRNNGDGTFTDITAASGMSANLNLDGIQCLFRDFDNDGFVDLLFTGSDHRLFRNNGNSTFTNLSNPFDSNDIESFAVGDLNSDGYLDIYAGYAFLFNSPSSIDDALFMNDGGSNNFFMVTLQGVTSNRNGAGARLELHGAWGKQIREVRAGEAYGIMNSFQQHFGIGSATQITRLVVHWPSGTVDELKNPAINQMLTLVEGSTIPVATEPFGSKLLDGVAISGQLSDLFASDDAYLELDPSPTKNPFKQKIDMILQAEAPTASPVCLEFRVEAAMIGGPSGDVIQTIELWNEASQMWEVLDTRAVSTTDESVKITATGDLTRFIHPLTDEIIAKVKWESPSFSGSTFSWSIDVDEAIWLIQ